MGKHDANKARNACDEATEVAKRVMVGWLKSKLPLGPTSRLVSVVVGSVMADPPLMAVSFRGADYALSRAEQGLWPNVAGENYGAHQSRGPSPQAFVEARPCAIITSASLSCDPSEAKRRASRSSRPYWSRGGLSAPSHSNGPSFSHWCNRALAESASALSASHAPSISGASYPVNRMRRRSAPKPIWTVSPSITQACCRTPSPQSAKADGALVQPCSCVSGFTRNHQMPITTSAKVVIRRQSLQLEDFAPDRCRLRRGRNRGKREWRGI